MQGSDGKGRGYNKNNNTRCTVKQKTKRQNKRDNRHKEKIAIQSIPTVEPVSIPTQNYASILKKCENTKSEIISKSAINTPIIPIISRRGFQKTSTQHRYNGSYGVWEYTYFKHILDLHIIFSNGIKKLGIETHTIYFLDKFCYFIRESSSGKISPFIEILNNPNEELYHEFTIKRNELKYKNGA
jgi:hypothetical protein